MVLLGPQLATRKLGVGSGPRTIIEAHNGVTGMVLTGISIGGILLSVPPHFPHLLLEDPVALVASGVRQCPPLLGVLLQPQGLPGDPQKGVVEVEGEVAE